MREKDDRSSIDHQAVAERKYAALKRAVEEAGFFAPHVVGEPRGHHIACTSEHRGGDVYTGRIVFVSETGGIWYIATPHPYHYRVVDASRASQAVIAFLDHGVRLSRDGEVIGGGENLQELVVRINYEEYEEAMSRAAQDR
jgi:hypothetical protein